MAYEIFGAIRIGSLRQELCIYQIGPSSRMKLLDRAAAVLPLGAETVSRRQLSAKSVEELCAVLSGFLEVMKSYKTGAFRAYATMALRDASNVDIVIDQIKVRTGIQVSVISNSEQRFLNYKALAAQNDAFDETIRTGTMIVDAGYGSMQFSLFDKGTLVSTENIPLGPMRLLNTFREMRFTDEQLREHVAELAEVELGNYKKLYLKNREIEHIVGIGETVNELFTKGGGLGTKAQHLAAEDALSLCRRICCMTADELDALFSGGREYAQLMLATAIACERMIRKIGCRDLWFPRTHFCDGVAAEYAEKQKYLKLSHNFENDIVAEARNMAKRYRVGAEHADMVERYVLAVFDAVRKISGLSRRDRLLLQIAAILHTCGKFISIKNGTECSYQVIRNTEMIGLSHAERELIAETVRYHTGEFDYHEAARIGNPVRMAKMTAILSLANALDRSHKGQLQDVRAHVDETAGEFVIMTGCAEDLTLERLSIRQRGAFFEEIYGLRPVLHQKKGSMT